MNVVNLSWYLCVLFAIALVAESAMAVAPGHSIFNIAGVWLALSILFAVVAIIVKWFRLPQPKWLLRIFQCFALLATAAVVLTVVG